VQFISECNSEKNLIQLDPHLLELRSIICVPFFGTWLDCIAALIVIVVVVVVVVAMVLVICLLSVFKLFNYKPVVKEQNRDVN